MISVVTVFVVLNCVALLVPGQPTAKAVEIYSAGFLMGMFAMYIAVHVYRS